jgi:hypothetical protein
MQPAGTPRGQAQAPREVLCGPKTLLETGQSGHV